MLLPEHLKVSREELGRGQPVKLRVLGDAASVANDFAQAILKEILQAGKEGRNATMILPVQDQAW